MSIAPENSRDPHELEHQLDCEDPHDESETDLDPAGLHLHRQPCPYRSANEDRYARRDDQCEVETAECRMTDDTEDRGEDNYECHSPCRVLGWIPANEDQEGDDDDTGAPEVNGFF